MKSGLYSGLVQHARPGKHRLRYRVFMLALDLDEIDAFDAKLNHFAHNRIAMMSVFDRDHAARIDAPLRQQIEAKLREAGIDCDGCAITLLTMPRILNYVFNPLSVYFCYSHDGSLAALVHQVNNTFGEHHFYVLHAAEQNGVVAQSCAKDFFVSPFLEMDLRYEFRIRPPTDDVSVAMIVKRGDEVALTASFAGAREELTDANLMRAWLANPLLTLKVIAGIHWEALKMVLKGVRYLGRSEPKLSAQRKAAT